MSKNQFVNRVVVISLLITVSFGKSTGNQGCIDEEGVTHSEGEYYGKPGGCENYYRCVNGEETKEKCPDGLVFDPALGVCNFINFYPECIDNDDESSDAYCSDGSGIHVDPATCEAYQCVNGIVMEVSCGPSLAFNPETGLCDWQTNFPVCVPEETTPVVSSTFSSTVSSTKTSPVTDSVSSTKTSPVTDSDSSTKTSPVTDSDSSTKTTSVTDSDSSTKTTSVTDSDSSTKTTSVTDSVSSTKTTPVTDSVSSTKTTPVTDSVSSSSNQDSTTQSTTTTTSISTTTAKTGEKFVVFVVDDTGSMANEIEGVKEWITNCIDGSYASCADSPSGGWVLSTFNDPEIGTAIGPEKDVSIIIDAVGMLHALGGGDCPERALAGVKEALSVIPDDNASCKLFFFTDALMNDEYLFENTQEMLITKGCTFIPTLTGCCGQCADPCPSVDPEYCIDHIHDSTTSSRRKRSISDPAAFTTQPEQKYYSMASKTGGDIYITEKPRSSDDFLEFLEEELTLGFCPTDLIAGPPPNGYTTEQDCNITNSCWDRSVGKCYCMSETEPCPTHAIFHCPTDLIAGPSPNGYETEIDCNITNSCWDRRVGKCYCMSETEPCPKEPVVHCPTEKIAGPPPNGYEIESDCNITKSCWDSRFERCYCNSETDPCPNVPVIPICRPEDGYFFSADITDCNMYYECNQGTQWKRPCAPGTVFDAETLRCDHLYNVKAPCGTLAS